jgi:YfiR/HmsC-like
MASGVRKSGEPERKIAPAGIIVVMCLGGVLLALPQVLRAQESSPDEYRVKLAFLYNFTKFVDWPDGSFRSEQTPLVICVVGTDPFGKALEDELSTRTSGSHPIAVARLAFSGDLSPCHVLFIRAEERKHLAAIFSRLKGRNILTVGETPGFLESGGQVNFVFVDKSLHFEINLAATRQTQLKFSSKLLALARNLAGPQGLQSPQSNGDGVSADEPAAHLRKP